MLLASLTAIGLGSSWGYFYGRNYYITRARVLTDATVVDVPPTVGTVGGECEAGVCLSDESEIGEDLKPLSTSPTRVWRAHTSAAWLWTNAM